MRTGIEGGEAATEMIVNLPNLKVIGFRMSRAAVRTEGIRTSLGVPESFMVSESNPAEQTWPVARTVDRVEVDNSD
jgi:hypothetical protein